MSGRTKATLFLTVMAILAYIAFYIYAETTGDSEGREVGFIVGSMLLVLAGLSFIKIRPWRK